MVYKIKILPIAEQDLENMVTYLNGLSSDLGLQFYDDVIKVIRSLKKFPGKNPLSKIPELRLKGYHTVNVRGYIVFYVITEFVEIRRVLHERQNYSKIL